MQMKQAEYQRDADDFKVQQDLRWGRSHTVALCFRWRRSGTPHVGEAWQVILVQTIGM